MKTVSIRNLFLAIIFLFSGAAYCNEWDSKLDQWVCDSEVVFLGRDTILKSKQKNNETDVYVSVVELRVNRLLKGTCKQELLDVEYESTHIEYTPELHHKDVVYFLEKKLENGHYRPLRHKWSGASWKQVENAVFRTEKDKKIAYMPKPDNQNKPISLTIGFDNYPSGVSPFQMVKDIGQAEILAQFENHSKQTHAVMPPLDGSFVHWRYPYYDIEIVNNEGNPVQPKLTGRCGNINPWHRKDFIKLEPGQIFRFRNSYLPYAILPPGDYQLRFKYTAKRDLNTKELMGPGNDHDFKSEMSGVWEGTIYSNWIKFHVFNN